MCIYDSKRFRFTFKRIPIYKLVKVEIRHEITPIFLGPFTELPLKSYMREKGTPSYYPNDPHLNYKYTEGFLHAFMEKDSARRCLETHQRLYPDSEFTILEGHIPAFTRIGKCWGAYGPEICARRMYLNFKDFNINERFQRNSREMS